MAEFTVTFPAYLLAERYGHRDGRLVLHQPLLVGCDGGTEALAVFTDRAAAERFRDDHAPASSRWGWSTRRRWRRCYDKRRWWRMGWPSTRFDPA